MTLHRRVALPEPARRAARRLKQCETATALLDRVRPLNLPTERARKLWAHPKIRTETIASLAASTVVLARLWASAWRVGKGKNLAVSKLRVFTEGEIQAVYSKKTFAPALTLDQMAKSGRFVVP